MGIENIEIITKALSRNSKLSIKGRWSEQNNWIIEQTAIRFICHNR